MTLFFFYGNLTIPSFLFEQNNQHGGKQHACCRQCAPRNCRRTSAFDRRRRRIIRSAIDSLYGNRIGRCESAIRKRDDVFTFGQRLGIDNFDFGKKRKPFLRYRPHRGHSAVCPTSRTYRRGGIPFREQTRPKPD